jgi:retinol dehydrogenase-12
VLNVFLTRELAARLPAGSPVVVDTVDPGFCHSELRRNVPFPFSIPMRVMEWTIARPTEEGARVFVWAALTGHDDPIQRDRVRGKYISFFEVDEESDFVLSTEGADAQRRIWVRLFCLPRPSRGYLRCNTRTRPWRSWRRSILTFRR